VVFIINLKGLDKHGKSLIYLIIFSAIVGAIVFLFLVFILGANVEYSAKLGFCIFVFLCLDAVATPRG
jgi:hypothetical protein